MSHPAVLVSLFLVVGCVGCSHATPAFTASGTRSAAKGVPDAGPSGSADSGTPAGAEPELLSLVNAERRRMGLAPLAWHDPAAQVARGHSRDMCSRGEIAHESPTTGSPADRVQRAGIHVPLVLENVARARTVAEIHTGLMNSPGHRANILNTEATHIGIGIVACSRPASSLYATQVFLRILVPFDTTAARVKLRKAIIEERRRRNAAPVGSDPRIDQVAQAMAENLARRGGDMPAEERQKALASVAARYGGVRAVVAIASDPLEAATGSEILAPAQAIGVGIAQGAHRELGDHAAYVVVLLAERS